MPRVRAPLPASLLSRTVLRNVFLYALVVSLILGTGFESLAAKPKEDVEWVRAMLPMEIDTEVSWKNCGTWNGYYFPGSHRIVLCNENLKEGVGPARFIYLHELGHAYTFQKGTDFLRWDGNYEDAADEWAALWSIVQGHPEDLLQVAAIYDEWGKMYTPKPGDPHSPMEVRATRLRSLYYGWKNPQGTFGDDYRATLAFWKEELLRNGINKPLD